MASTFCKIATLGPQRLIDPRSEVINYYQVRAEQFTEAETSIHEKLDQGVGEVVKSKNILLFKEMLKEIKYNDIAVVDLLMT